MQFKCISLNTSLKEDFSFRPRSSGVERILGKNEVMGSIPIEGSIFSVSYRVVDLDEKSGATIFKDAP